MRNHGWLMGFYEGFERERGIHMTCCILITSRDTESLARIKMPGCAGF